MAFGWSSKYIIWYFTWEGVNMDHFEYLFGQSSTLEKDKNTCLPSQMSTVSDEQTDVYQLTTLSQKNKCSKLTKDHVPNMIILEDDYFSFKVTTKVKRPK